MAWPLSRYATFIANSVPVISAAFLNLLQDTTNDLFNAVVSLKALVVDGTGGVAVTGRAGTVKVSAADSGVAAGLPLQTVALGELSKPLVPVAWAVVSSAGALLRGVNIKSCTRAALGTYVIVANVGGIDLVNACPVANITSGAAGIVQALNSQDDGGGRVQINVSTAQLNTPASGAASASAAADYPFQVVLFAA